MPIPQQRLREAALRASRTKFMTLSEAKSRLGQRTAFLCHSHKDLDLVRGLQVLLVENGFEVYIDWQDTDMPAEPDRDTAERIKTRIKSLDWFLFLATANSVASRWCPWEIGVADNAKENPKILVIATVDQSGKWYGNEYLKLYRQITPNQLGSLVAVPPGTPADRGISLSTAIYY
jgi:hypothetical protein